MWSGSILLLAASTLTSSACAGHPPRLHGTRASDPRAAPHEEPEGTLGEEDAGVLPGPAPPIAQETAQEDAGSHSTDPAVAAIAAFREAQRILNAYQRDRNNEALIAAYATFFGEEQVLLRTVPNRTPVHSYGSYWSSDTTVLEASDDSVRFVDYYLVYGTGSAMVGDRVILMQREADRWVIAGEEPPWDRSRRLRNYPPPAALARCTDVYDRCVHSCQRLYARRASIWISPTYRCRLEACSCELARCFGPAEAIERVCEGLP
jgi:hypothetical protein